MAEKQIMVKIDHVSKEYRLGAIGGTTLREDLERFHAKIRKKEDPTLKIGQKTPEYGKRFMALKDISFEVEKGEAVGIIGHNGAGKSTLLKLLSRVTAPTKGSIGMNGRVASMLEVGTGFHPELTGRENIYMNGAILGMSRAEIGEKLDQIIAFSECGEFIDTPVKRYSSGMYVKLAFSVAAHLDSEIMIMDEVLAVGDMKFQQKCLGRMGKAANSEEKTILYVSHNMNTIRQLCTRCLVLDHGELIFDGGVERAIDLYMDTAVKNGSVDIDLKNKRMAHLPPVIKAKMTHVHLVDKQVPVYEFEEKLKFDLSVEAKTNIFNLSVRAEIRSADGGSVAAGILQEFTSFFAGRSKILEMELLLRGLVPGKYFVLLVIYNVNEMGTYDDLDAVFPAFTFEIQDSKHALKINWNVNAWGKIRLDDLKCVGERDDS